MNKKDYAYRALMLRIKSELRPEKNVMILPQGNDLCRIIYSGGRLVVAAKDEVREPLINWLRLVNVEEEIKSPDFYKSVLKTIGKDSLNFELEPSDAFIDESKSYNGHHTMEYVCDARG